MDILRFVLKYEEDLTNEDDPKNIKLISLQNPKWPPGGPKMADRVLKGVYL